MSIKKDDRASQKNPEMPEKSVLCNGVFKRPNFAKTVTSLIGNNVKVKTKNGSTYEGVFSSLTPDFDVVVDLSHKVGEDDPFYGRVEKDAIVFKPEDIVSISCVNVNLKDALGMSQRLDLPGDFSAKIDETWNDRQNPAMYDKEWNELFRNKKGNFGNSECSEGSTSFSTIYSHPELSKIDGATDNFDGQNELSGDYPKSQRKTNISSDGSISEDFAGEVTSKLNPYAKPFTPMETLEKDYQVPLAAVVLPTYVVPGKCPSKLDASRQIVGGAASFLGGGSLHHQYEQYPYDYDEKLYSSYDSLPITAHDYQQYYPHLQYIQYFRRFY